MGKVTRYNKNLIAHHEPLSAASEAFKIARTNIEFSSIDQKLRTILVTSSNQSEGKSTTLANLAITYAQVGRKVLLIDADLRRPSVHKLFGIPNRRGLTNALLNHSEFTDLIVPTMTSGLDILTSGPIPPNPTELMMSESMSALIEEAKTIYDLIMFDCAPIGVVTDAAIMSTKVDAALFVIKSGHTDRHQLKRSASLLNQVNARVLGYILTGVSRKNNDNYYYYARTYTDRPGSGGKGRVKNAADRAASFSYVQTRENPQKSGFSAGTDRPVTPAKTEQAAPNIRRPPIRSIEHQGIVSEDD